MRQATSRRPAVTSPPIPNRIPSRRRRRYPEGFRFSKPYEAKAVDNASAPLQAIPGHARTHARQTAADRRTAGGLAAKKS